MAFGATEYLAFASLLAVVGFSGFALLVGIYHPLTRTSLVVVALSFLVVAFADFRSGAAWKAYFGVAIGCALGFFATMRPPPPRQP